MLSEFVISQTAARYKIDNTPNNQQIENLYRVAYTLEIVRKIFKDQAIIVTSGYRSIDLNTAIKGSKTSAHMQGLAADFIIPGWQIEDIVDLLQNKIGYDQLINEFGRWVHIGLSKTNRQQVLNVN